MNAFVNANPASSVKVRREDGTYMGCDIYGDYMEDSVFLADGSCVDRNDENMAKPLLVSTDEQYERVRTYQREHGLPVWNPAKRVHR